MRHQGLLLSCFCPGGEEPLGWEPAALAAAGNQLTDQRETGKGLCWALQGQRGGVSAPGETPPSLPCGHGQGRDEEAPKTHPQGGPQAKEAAQKTWY